MRYLFTIILCVIMISAHGQLKPDTVLQKKVKLMFDEDQKWRKEADKVNNGEKSVYSQATIDKNETTTDSLNLIQAKAIIKKYGFPGYDLIGEGYSNDFWAIVQHCDDDVKFQQQVLPLLKKQVELKNASGQNYALLQDRVLINTGKKQLYGTQVRYNPQTKQAKPFPIQDSLNVDKRRKEVGLSPLKDYLKLFDRR